MVGLKVMDLFSLGTVGEFYFIFYFCFWPHCVARGILLPRPGIEPGPSAVKAQSPNHWTAREVPCGRILNLTGLEGFMGIQQSPQNFSSL